MHLYLLLRHHNFPNVFFSRYHAPSLGRCERVLRVVGHEREVQGRQKCRMEAVKWAVAKLQGDKTASFCREMSGREVTGR